MTPPPTAPTLQTHFHAIRKLLTLGHSYAVTLPTAWVKKHCTSATPYILATPNADGTITLRPFDPQNPVPKT
jgi:hypothetical protein